MEDARGAGDSDTWLHADLSERDGGDADVEDELDDSDSDGMDWQGPDWPCHRRSVASYSPPPSDDVNLVNQLPRSQSRGMHQNSLMNLRRGGRRQRSPGAGWEGHEHSSDDAAEDLLLAAQSDSDGEGGKPVTAHGQRMEAEHEGWEKSRAAMGEEWVRTSGLRHAHAQQLRGMELQAVQQRACDDWRFHTCGGGQWHGWLSERVLGAGGGAPPNAAPAYQATASTASPPESTEIELKSLSTVTYMSSSCRHQLYVPVWWCRQCECAFSASPVRAGCWPSRYQDAGTWIAEALLEDCQRLVMKGGLSVTREWCGGLTHIIGNNRCVFSACLTAALPCLQ
jgi:hypothetical protein